MRIDLRMLRDPLKMWIEHLLQEFSIQHPNIRISTMGILGDGFHGMASLHLNTLNHSNDSVMKWKHNGPAWFGEDEKGRYCKSCNDFKFCVGEFLFPEYPDLYERDSDDLLEFVNLDGTQMLIKLGDEDEGINRIVFPMLKQVLHSLEPLNALSKDSNFRLGVEMHDSNCLEFWLLDKHIQS